MSVKLTVCALYCFEPIADPQALVGEMAAFCGDLDLCGTLLVATEGVNGTLAGPQPAVEALLARLRGRLDFARAEIKFSTATERPFRRMKVRLKREIVTLGVDDIDPRGAVGHYVEPADWNRLIDDPDTVVIDTRNDYEIAIGSFDGAIDPGTASFRQFPDWLERHGDELDGKRIAMFCTGGIRCEKATAFLRSRGHDDVHHLKGGILAYLEQVPETASRWQGECFVFDERVSVGHGLRGGSARLCRACRHPLSEADRADPRHREGVACIHCHDGRSEADRARYEERHRQMEIAERRGLRHLGG